MSSNETGSQTGSEETARDTHVCPWWVGYLLASPIRKWRENPDALLAPLVTPGSVVVDIGCAMGFFSLPAARLVGSTGRVVCVDVQERMLLSLEKRAGRRRLLGPISTHQCTQEDLGLQEMSGQADLVLAIHVVHETAYPKRWFQQVWELLRPGGRLIVAEPAGHVSETDFEGEKHIARKCGFGVEAIGGFKKSRSMMCTKPAAG